jgi:hypothetical protein
MKCGESVVSQKRVLETIREKKEAESECECKARWSRNREMGEDVTACV